MARPDQTKAPVEAAQAAPDRPGQPWAEPATPPPGLVWAAPPTQPLPGPGEVLLFLAALDVTPDRLAQLRSTFSPREHARADKFAHDAHRFRWCASRGTLREILGAALGIPPAQVGFTAGAHGKPALHPSCAPPGGLELHFNISHSAGLALLALARAEVGVDIELPLARRRTDDLARRFYAPGEQQRLFAEPDAEARASYFFRLWTCKEALMKATGEGLSRPLGSYQIELQGDRARLLWAKGIDDAATRYSVHPLEPGQGYSAALVVEGQGLSLRQFRWPA